MCQQMSNLTNLLIGLGGFTGFYLAIAYGMPIVVPKIMDRVNNSSEGGSE